MEIPIVETNCTLRTDGRTDRETDMAKLIAANRNFENAYKNAFCV